MLGDDAFPCPFVKKRHLIKDLGFVIIFLPYAWWRQNQSMLFQAQKEVSCYVFFKLAIGLYSVSTLAEFSENITSSSEKMMLNESLDKDYIVCMQF